MAGSYRHLLDDDGTLRPFDWQTSLIENLGDAFEALEECFGMIQVLAAQLPDPAAAIEDARLRYKEGVRLGGGVPFDER